MPSVVPQPVVAKLTRAAIFLVVTINPGKQSETAVRALCADLSALLRAVGFRDLEARLSCVMGIGSDAWDRLFGKPRPKELHRFREIHGVHHAVSTPGDLGAGRRNRGAAARGDGAGRIARSVRTVALADRRRGARRATTPTMRCRRNFIPVLPICAMRGIGGAAPSCVRKPSGGGTIAASSPII